MILLWFVLGILLALSIARYNESNKLFWTLALAFVLGFAATVMVHRTIDSQKQSENDSTQVYPTQVSLEASGFDLFPLADALSAISTLNVTDSDPVSQDYTPAFCGIVFIQSEISGKTRDQPSDIIKPPEIHHTRFDNTS